MALISDLFIIIFFQFIVNICAIDFNGRWKTAILMCIRYSVNVRFHWMINGKSIDSNFDWDAPDIKKVCKQISWRWNEANEHERLMTQNKKKLQKWK